MALKKDQASETDNGAKGSTEATASVVKENKSGKGTSTSGGKEVQSKSQVTTDVQETKSNKEQIVSDVKKVKSTSSKGNTAPNVRDIKKAIPTNVKEVKSSKSRIPLDVKKTSRSKGFVTSDVKEVISSKRQVASKSTDKKVKEQKGYTSPLKKYVKNGKSQSQTDSFGGKDKVKKGPEIPAKGGAKLIKEEATSVNNGAKAKTDDTDTRKEHATNVDDETDYINVNVDDDTGDDDFDKGDDDEVDIVISGVSCRLPQCNNMAEFSNNLLSNVEMTESTHMNDYGSELWNGLQHTDKFDAAYFGVSDKEANRMDPETRILLELVTESVLDAGIKPSSLRYEQVGVYIGVGAVDSREISLTDTDNINERTTTSNVQSSMADKIKLLMDLTGPSYCIQGNDGASGVALDRAYHDMLSGEINAAIVAGSSISFKPTSVLKYQQLGLLSECFMSRPFDSEADGFVGSDGVVAMFLQYGCDAKRIYAAILHSSSILSPVEDGVSYPSVVNQADFLEEVYTDIDIDPADVEYVELHATGVVDHDTEEIEAVYTALCADRHTPLQIGSVKSNTGHTLATSGLVSIAKILVASEEGVIPATCNISDINPDIPELHDGTIQVVTENTRPLDRLFGVNILGMGGYHTHCILDGNVPTRVLHYMAARRTRLCVYCGRTEAGVRKALKFLYDNNYDIELQALSNETATMSALKMPYRGFCLLNSEENIVKIQRCSSRTVHRPVWFVFSGMGTQWPGMGRKMMELDTFKSSILESSEVLHQYGINLYKLIMEKADNSYERPLNSFIVITAIQIGLVNLLREMGIEPEGMIGHSSGEIACGYANGCLTAREAILAAYWEGFCIQELDPLPGAMAAVGLTWNEAKQQCPPGVVPACHNADTTVTVSGPVDKVHQFVQQLKDLGIFTREVKSAGVAFHSPAINGVVPLLRKYLSKLIEPKPKSPSWISTSVPEDEWDSDLNKHCSVDYLINNLTSPVLFQEALKHIPPNSVVVEIGPHDLLQTILKRSLDKDIYHVGLMKRHHPNNVNFFFKSLGKCYMEGIDLNPLGIFPPIDFPVPRGTPSLSSLIEWDHTKSWRIPQPEDFLGGGHGQWSQSTFTFDVRHDGKDDHLTGHMINGDNLFPVSGLVVMVWKALAKYHGTVAEHLPVTLTDIKIHRQVVIPESGHIEFDVNVIPLLGDFEITADTELVASGNILDEGTMSGPSEEVDQTAEHNLKLCKDDIYQEFEMRGHCYHGNFRSLKELNVNGDKGIIQWTNDWMTYIDGMIQACLLDDTIKCPMLPQEIKSITINPDHHKTVTQQGFGSVTIESDIQAVTSGGLCISGLKTKGVPLVEMKPTQIDSLQFVPLEEIVASEHHNLDDHLMYGKICARIALQCLTGLVQQADKIGTTIPYKATLEGYIAESQGSDGATDIDLDKHKDLTGTVRIYLEELKHIPYDEHYFHNVQSLRQDFENFMKYDHVIQSLGSARSLKPCLDIVSENSAQKTIRILEVCADPSTLLHASIQQTLTPTDINMEYHMSGDVHVDGCSKINWKIDQKLPQSTQPFDLIVLDNVLCQQPDVTRCLANVVHAVEDGGFVLVKETTQQFLLAYVLNGFSREKVTQEQDRTFGPWMNEEEWNDLFVGCGLQTVAKKQDGVMSTLFLLRKESKGCEKMIVSGDSNKLNIDLIDADNLATDWFADLTKKMVTRTENNMNQPITVCMSEDPLSGLSDMFEHWKKNTNTRNFRFVQIEDKSDELCKGNIETSPVFVKQFQKNLVSNVYRQGTWGSYHTIPTPKYKLKEIQSCSSFVKGIGVPPIPSLVTKDTDVSYKCLDDTDLKICYPRYCVVNNQSVATVNGKHYFDTLSKMQGLNKLDSGFSGYDDSGRRIMGISTDMHPGTKLYAKKYLTWEVPESWRLEDACAVPVTYLMAYHLLFVCAELKKDQSLLILGTTDVSEAVVTVATQQYNTVFASSELVNMMSQTRGTPIDNGEKSGLQVYSDINDVLMYTKGTGVDVIVNCSKFDPKLTVGHLLIPGGHLINMNIDNSDRFTMDMEMQQKECKVSSFGLDNLSKEDDIRHVSELMHAGIKSGEVKPLQSIVYSCEKIPEAYSYKLTNMESNVAIKFGEDNQTGPTSLTAVKILACSPQKCYIIVNAMTKCGLSLADWLIEHGATKLFLTSSCSTHTGYETKKLKQWYLMGITVNDCSKPNQTLDDTQRMISEAKKLGPIGGVFYIPMIDKESSLSHGGTSPTSLAKHLDTVTRTVCNKTLDWFVVMPVHCCSGKCDQSAYIYVNASLQRIVDQRSINGYPGLCLSLSKPECKYQPTTSSIVLNSLEMLLQQCNPVIILTVDDNSETDITENHTATVKELFETFKILLDIDHLTTSLENFPLYEICRDDTILENISDLLKSTLNLSFTHDTIMKMTLGELKAICTTAAADDDNDANEGANVTRDKPETNEHAIHYIHDNKDCITKINSVHNKHTPVYIVYDEDEFDDIVSLAGRIDSPVYGVCTSSQDVPMESVQCQAGFIIQSMFVNNNIVPLVLIGLRMGCAVAIEIALQLQKEDLDVVKHIICIEGSVEYVPLDDELCFYQEDYQTLDYTNQEQEALMTYIQLHSECTEEVIEAFDSIDPTDLLTEAKVSSLVPYLLTDDKLNRSKIQSRMLHYVQTHMLTGEYEHDAKYKGNITLIRGRGRPKDIKTPSDYYLSKVCEDSVAVHILNTGHTGFLQETKDEISHTINALLYKVTASTAVTEPQEVTASTASTGPQQVTATTATTGPQENV